MSPRLVVVFLIVGFAALCAANVRTPSALLEVVKDFMAEQEKANAEQAKPRQAREAVNHKPGELKEGVVSAPVAKPGELKEGVVSAKPKQPVNPQNLTEEQKKELVDNGIRSFFSVGKMLKGAGDFWDGLTS